MRADLFVHAVSGQSQLKPALILHPLKSLESDPSQCIVFELKENRNIGKKWYLPEEIISWLRQVEVQTAQGILNQ